MSSDSISTLKAAIRDVPDFPKEGIVFKDITPILSDPRLFSLSLDCLIDGLQAVSTDQVDKIAGIDARGFIFGAALAERLGIGFVPIRKAGKLPHECNKRAYALEYGNAEIEVHTDAFASDENVWLVDDLLATGGTASAASEMILESGAKLLAVSFLIELGFLDGRARFSAGLPILAPLQY